MFAVFKVARYAFYAAACCFVYKKIEKCCGKLFAKKDPWNITEEAIGEELGAGHVFKQDGMLGFWVERYLAIKENRLILYADQTRTQVKGEFALAAAYAGPCSGHADEEAKFYFNLTHPDQGIREFYVISEPRRAQWLELITAQGSRLERDSIFGILSKIGGITKTKWDDRWCICVGPTLIYYASKDDDMPVGSLWLVGAHIRDSGTKGGKYSIEIIQDASATQARKGKKKYTFAASSESSRTLWLEALQRRASPRVAEAEVINPLNSDSATSPMRGPGEAGRDAFPEKPKTSMKGYLEKKGKRLGGFTKRFYVLEPKEPPAGGCVPESDIRMLYYNTEAQFAKKEELKGFIKVSDLTAAQLPKREGSLEFTFSVKGKACTLRASSPQERDEWVAHMNAWYQYIQAVKRATTERAAGGR